MSVKLELYRVFKAVCEHRNISEAAKTLYISQPAVSQSIKQLEEQLGTVLFSRRTKGVVPTPEGQLLYEYASSAIGLIDVAEQKLAMMSNLSLGELRIAASDTLSRYLLLPILQQYNRRYPDIRLNIINRTTDESIAMIRSGQVDLAFVNMPVNDKDVELAPFLSVEDIFVSAPMEVHKSSYTLDEVAQMRLILLENKANSRRYVDRYFAENGVTLTPEIELGSHDLLLEFARIGLGVSCVTEQFSRSYLEIGELVQLTLDTPIPPRAIGIVQLKGVSLSSASQQFLQIAAEKR